MPLEVQIRTHEDAPGRRVRRRRALALQGGRPTSDASTTQHRLAAPPHRVAARRLGARTEFVECVKIDVFQDQVFVFTPKGDITTCRRGATPLDFAYRIHTDVGHRTLGAKVNDRTRAARLPAQERRRRRDRDDQGRAGPSRDWLNVVRHEPRPREDPPMVQAQGPRREHRPRPRVARARAATPGADVDRRSRADKIAEVGSHFNYESVDDFYAAIGYGAVGAAGRGHAARGRRRRPQPAADDGTTQQLTRPAASGSRASATCWSASPSAARRSRAIRSSASSPAARA